MLKPRKKLTKRELKEDKFVTAYLKAQDFLTQNRQKILSGMGIVAVAVIAIFIFSRKQQEKEQNAVVELTKAKTHYFAEDYETALPLLENLVNSYSGIPSGNVGIYYLANTYFLLGRYDDARTRFEEFVNEADGPVLTPAAMAGIAACYEEQGKFTDAAGAYERAAVSYSEGYLAPENLLSSARCYTLAGNKDEAKRILSKLLDEYATSSLKNDAETMLAELNS